MHFIAKSGNTLPFGRVLEGMDLSFDLQAKLLLKVLLSSSLNVQLFSYSSTQFVKQKAVLLFPEEEVFRVHKVSPI